MPKTRPAKTKEKKSQKLQKAAPVLAVRDLRKEFGGIIAVHDCGFTVEQGAIVGLIGPNGAGKTTVFNLITGCMKVDKGSVVFDGADITNMEPYKINRMGLSRTFQMIRLFQNMTVMENMMTAKKNMNERLWRSFIKSRMMRDQEIVYETQCLELLRFVGLEEKKEELAKNLSYGQQKLLEIARALASDPELLLLDEPAGGVNLTMLNNIRNIILDLKKKGKTILLIEHNMEFVMGLCDKIIVLDYGEEIAAGTPKQIQKNKKVLDAYLGGIDEKIVT